MERPTRSGVAPDREPFAGRVSSGAGSVFRSISIGISISTISISTSISISVVRAVFGSLVRSVVRSVFRSDSGSVVRSVSALALAVTACGCGSSALVPEGDATFARAMDRLERTNAEVEALNAPPRERLQFMQAESFYRYRFSTNRGTASVMAEAAAAATDLPILQSLSGSLDVMDLRLRSADAAVQLWETLLKRNPDSRLKPLVLYRLGFAYRNTVASGLPRDSGDEAFDELEKTSPPPPPELAQAAAEARCLPWKSKDRSATLSLVPGMGQFYVHDYASGAARLGIALAAAAAIIVPIVMGAQRGSDLTWRQDWPLLVSGTAGLIVLSFDYTSSYEDAQKGVVHWNEREEAKFEDTHPPAP